MKRCPRCNSSKKREEFNVCRKEKDGLCSWCRSCSASYQKERYHRDITDSRKRTNKNRARQVDARRESSRKWVRKNPGWWKKYRVARKNYVQQQLKDSLEFKLIRYLRTRLYHALKAIPKFGKTLELLGLSSSELRSHLESQFRPGMTWENYGPVWHVDHIKPCAKFDLTDPEQQRACFHWTNLQPLFARDNLQKGAK